MDFFAFMTTWFWYVMAFAAGALVAWLVSRQLIPAQSAEEAVDRAVAHRRTGDAHGERIGDGYDDDDAEIEDMVATRYAATRSGATSEEALR